MMLTIAEEKHIFDSNIKKDIADIIYNSQNAFLLEGAGYTSTVYTSE